MLFMLGLSPPLRDQSETNPGPIRDQSETNQGPIRDQSGDQTESQHKEHPSVHNISYTLEQAEDGYSTRASRVLGYIILYIV